MSWLGYIVLLHLWTCCTFQKAPVFFQEQATYQDLVNPQTDYELPRSCGPPPAVTNAMLVTSQRRRYSSGSTVIYQCYRLFEMDGTPLAMCLNGQWRGVPQCLDDSLPETGHNPSNPVLNAIDYKIPYDERKFKQIMWLKMPRDMTGKQIETCRAEEWEMEQNNIQLRSITKSTSMTASDYWMEFECKRGFHKDPSSSPFRKQCVRGPWLYPRCI